MELVADKKPDKINPAKKYLAKFVWKNISVFENLLPKGIKGKCNYCYKLSLAKDRRISNAATLQPEINIWQLSAYVCSE